MHALVYHVQSCHNNISTLHVGARYADVGADAPQLGYSVWASILISGVATVNISKNDLLYRPPWARDRRTTAYTNYQPSFICSVSTHLSHSLLFPHCTC